jgi:hypothetical protein
MITKIRDGGDDGWRKMKQIKNGRQGTDKIRIYLPAACLPLDVEPECLAGCQFAL